MLCLDFIFISGVQNYKLKWKGPYQRSDRDSRYPERMSQDTLKYVNYVPFKKNSQGGGGRSICQFQKQNLHHSEAKLTINYVWSLWLWVPTCFWQVILCPNFISLQTNCCLVIFINTVIKVGRIAN
jgi:hypothetical protein